MQNFFYKEAHFMIRIDTLVLGPLQTNCYVVHAEDSTTCVVVDPAHAPEKILEFTAARGLTIEAILLTHGHFDHVGAVRDIAAETDCRVYICPEDLRLPHAFTAGPIYYTDTYGEGTRLHLAGLDIAVLQTPGHTPGSVCLICGNVMFSGDTLFAGDCGRTDLPGGSPVQMMQSLRRLAAIEADLTVYPGHGESTTLAQERQYNPYMR